MHKAKPSLTPEIGRSIKNFEFHSNSSSPNHNSLGHEKLQVFHQNKQLVKEIGLVSNKINLITKLELRTKDQLAKQKKQAEEILQKKARNESKQREKEIWNDYKRKEVEELRKKHFLEKQKRKTAIKALQSSIIRERQGLAKEAKKTRADLEELGRSYKEMVQEKNWEMKNSRIKEVLSHRNKSNTLNLRFTEELKIAYQEKILQEKKLYLELMNKMKEVEKQEALVIENYSKTLKNAGIVGVLLSPRDDGKQ
jgi:hypothetical protein